SGFKWSFSIDTAKTSASVGTTKETPAATATPFESFDSDDELAKLIAGWPADRLVAVWNSLPGVTPAKRLKSANAASRIWERIQGLGEAAKPEVEPAKPKATKKTKGGAHSAKG